MSGNAAAGAQDEAQNNSSSSTAADPPPHQTPITPNPSSRDAPTSSTSSSSSSSSFSSSSAGRVARTWVRFAKAFVLVFPVYALGYLEFSVSWLLIGLAVVFFWRRNASWKSSRLSRALAFLHQQHRHMEEEERSSGAARALETTELPSWVHFPDVERVEWVNKTVNQIWPYACRFLEKIFRENIEPAVKRANTHLSTFSFTRVDLGDKPLRVNGVKVYTENVDTRQIIMDLQISFVANTEIEMDIKRYYCKAGIKSIQLHGVMRVVLEPLMGKMPLVGAFSFFFLKKPLLDVGWAGLTNILDIPGLNGFSDSLIQDVISRYLVLPNRITVPLVGDVELEQLRFPMPKGVLRIHFLEAQDLEGKDKLFGGLIKGKSDPYGVVQVANQSFQSKTIKECLNPKWNEVFEATVYEHSGQHLEIELFDEDPDKDDFLGSLMIDLTKLYRKQKIEEWFDLEEVSSGKLHLKLEWLSLWSSADKLQQALWSIRHNDSLSSALLMVYLDSAQNLPSEQLDLHPDSSKHPYRGLLKSGRKVNSDPSPYVQLTVGRKTCESKVRYKTCEPIWDEAFTFLVHNPHTQELQVEVKDNKHKCMLGNMRVALARLIRDEDMSLVQQFPLSSSGPNSTLKLKLVLRILCLEKETTSGQPSLIRLHHTSQSVTMSQTNTTTTTTTTTNSTPTTHSSSTTQSTSTTHTTPCSSPVPTGVTLRGKRGSEGSPVSLVQTEMQRDSPRRDSKRRDSTRRDSTRRDSTRRDSTRRNSTRRDSTQRESTHRDSTQSLASDASLPSAALELQQRLAQLQNGSTQYHLGEVQLTIRHSSQRNKLIVVAHACRNLISLGKDGSDPYIRLYLLPDKSRSGRRKTSTVRKNLNPIYDQSFEFSVSAVELHRRTLDVAVKNAGGLLSKNKGLLGKVFVDLGNEEISKGWTRWWRCVARLTLNNTKEEETAPCLYVITQVEICARVVEAEESESVCQFIGVFGSVMSKRKEFLESLHPDQLQEFIHFIKLHKDASEPFDLCELVQELQVKQRLDLWNKLLVLLTHTLQSCPSERWISRLDQDPDGDDMEVEQSQELKHTMSVLEGVTLVCTVCVDLVQTEDQYTDLLNCAYTLNSVESCLPVSEVPLLKAIHWLFECWWRRGLRGKEELGWTAFVACLENTVTLKKTLSELNRLYSLRDVLLSVEFDSEKGQYITNPLLQCFLSTHHIKREEGKRFLAFLFSWDVGFIKMIHETIKNQLQFLSKSVAEDVAEIYFRAWRKASSPFLEEIETSCIQELMQHAILLHRTSPLQGKVRQILAYLHKQKFRHGVDEMLHRLYMPILWKSLKAGNAEVRANATLLFTEAFPVHDPNMSSERVDELVQKQLDTLFALLEDVSPSVRCAAVLGACSVVSRCWELLPSSIVTDLLKKLLELASDSSSPDCRCAVFMCMSMILDNRMSHPLMEKLLPALKLSLHDTSEKVRVAFIDLLLKIKAVRAAKFWKVCSMEHLLARLEQDSVCVSKRIVKLLFSSFFPVAQPETVWCERCVSIIQMNPGAARKFYHYAYIYTAPTNIVKLMLTIRKCLNACIQKTGENPDESVCSNKENNSVLEDVLSVKDTAVMASLLELVVILWKSVQKSLKLNQEALQYTTAKFASVLPEYLRVFQDERCTAALLRLASFLPVSAVPAFRSKVLAQLKRLNSGSPVSQYGQLIECVCDWGQLSHVLDLAVDWLTEAPPLKMVDASGRDVRDSRRVQFHESEGEAKPEIGLDYLEYLLSRSHTRDSVLCLSVDQLTPLITALAAWKEVLYSSLSEGEVSEAVMETALRAFGLHSRLTVHLHHKHPEGRSFLTTLEESMNWIEKRVLPFLVAPGDSVSEQQLGLSRRIVEVCLHVCRDAVRVSLGDSDFKDQVLQLCSYVLLSEKGYTCVPVLLSLLSEVAQDCVSCDSEEQEEQMSVSLRIIANIFQKVLEVMAHRLRKDKEEGQELCCSSVDALNSFLLVTQSVSERSEVMTGIFSSLCAAIIIDISRTLQKVSDPEEVTTPETVTDLPPLSNCIMSAILKSPAVTRCFLSEMSSTVDSEAIDSIGGLAAITHVLAIIRKTEKFSADLKAIGVSVHRQILHNYGVTADESPHRFLYENAVAALNELLMPGI